MPQYKKCPSESKLLQIALKQIEVDKDVQAHISKCTNCLETLHTIKAMHYELQTTSRPLPASASKKAYYSGLKACLKQLPSKQKSVSFRFKPAFVLGLSALFIFTLGVWMGKIWNSSTTSVQLSQNTASEIQFMNHYLEQSEMWLLTIMNQPNNSNPHWEVNDRMLTQQLLQQTYQLERETDLFNHPRLIPFIEQIETLLLEVANTDSTQIASAFSLIRKAVEERQLLLQNQNIQKDLAESSPLNVSRL